MIMCVEFKEVAIKHLNVLPKYLKIYTPSKRQLHHCILTLDASKAARCTWVSII